MPAGRHRGARGVRGGPLSAALFPTLSLSLSLAPSLALPLSLGGRGEKASVG